MKQLSANSVNFPMMLNWQLLKAKSKVVSFFHQNLISCLKIHHLIDKQQLFNNMETNVFAFSRILKYINLNYLANLTFNICFTSFLGSLLYTICSILFSNIINHMSSKLPWVYPTFTCLGHTYYAAYYLIRELVMTMCLFHLLHFIFTGIHLMVSDEIFVYY